MDLHDMHIWFRQYAQQMGMQNVRAILPEQIDLLINTSINDVVNQLIRENIGITNDRVITDNSKIGQINAFKTLYKVVELPMFDTDSASTSYFYIEYMDRNIGKFSNKRNLSVPDDYPQMPSYLFLVDFAINYRQAGEGFTFQGGESVLDNYSNNEHEFSGPLTNYFPVRIIDDAYLADTLNDFVLKPRVRTPIMVVHSGKAINVTESGVSKQEHISQYDLYIEGLSQLSNNSYTLRESLVPYKLRMSYIAKPRKVKYLEDINGTNIDSDLPESMHIDILKHAVDLYRTSVSGALYATQQQADNNAREAQRNNYRNENN